MRTSGKPIVDSQVVSRFAAFRGVGESCRAYKARLEDFIPEDFAAVHSNVHGGTGKGGGPRPPSVPNQSDGRGYGILGVVAPARRRARLRS